MLSKVLSIFCGHRGHWPQQKEVWMEGKGHTMNRWENVQGVLPPWQFWDAVMAHKDHFSQNTTEGCQICAGAYSTPSISRHKPPCLCSRHYFSAGIYHHLSLYFQTRSPSSFRFDSHCKRCSQLKGQLNFGKREKFHCIKNRVLQFSRKHGKTKGFFSG